MDLIKNLLKNNKEDKFNADICVPGTEFSFPLTVIQGGKGPRVLVQAGLHNAEFPGIQAAIELIKIIKPQEISGTLLIIPLLNTSGFFNRTMSYVYEDGKNLNRVFPGNPEGSVSEKIAYFLQNEIYRYLDYFIDLHSGDCYESLKEFVFVQGKASEPVRNRSLEMAKQVDVPFAVATQSDSSGAYNYAAQLGVPAVLIERGCGGVWTEEQVNQDIEDVLNILKSIGMLKGEPRELPDKPVYEDIIYELCQESGFWYPLYSVGSSFEKDTVLGQVKNINGEVLQTVYALGDGFILYETVSLNVLKGDPLLAYAKC